MDIDTKCPNCGSYKLVSKRLYYFIAAIALLGCGVWLLIIPPVGIGVIAFGLLSLAAAFIAKGRLCTHCNYRTA